MNRLDALIAVALLAPMSGLAAAPAVGYAQATGYFKKETRPTLYQPLNLLDGREITAWCTQSSDSLNDKLRFGFKGVVKIDEIRIYTGNGADDKSFQEFSRGKKFSLKGQRTARQFTVSDQRGLQSVMLKPAIVGPEVTLEILDQYPAEDPEAPVCITDVVFYSEGKPLNGSWLTPKLKYDRNKSALLGTWYAGYDGAPERFLSFFFDGTYRYVFDPIEQGEKKPRAFTGEYEANGSRVVLEIPGKGKVTAHLRREKGEDAAKKTISFDGSELPEDLKQVFRDAP